MMMEQQEKYIGDIFNLPPAERIAAVDKMIDQMQTMMNSPEVAAARARGAAAAGRGTASSPPQSFGRDENGQSKRVQQDKRMLNSSSSRMRAMGDELGRIMTDRMRQRGISIPGM